LKRSHILAPLLLAAAVCSAAAWGHARREPVRVEVPFETGEHKMILIRATVAGRPATFILDTGTELTLLDREYSGLPKREHKQTDAAGGHGIATVAFAQVSVFCVAQHCVKDMKVAVGEFAGISKLLGRRIDGTIGQDLLRAFDEVTIDYKKSTVTFSIEGEGQ
jgi:hypothetical protein